MGARRDITLGLLGLAALLLAACGGQEEYIGAPVPWDYPLMPGDASLWKTLSVEEQRRALDFLADGSTIRSSLGEDE